MSVFSDRHESNVSAAYKSFEWTFLPHLPARIALLDTSLDLKTRGCGFDSRADQPNSY